MSQDAAAEGDAPLTIYTIGHSNHPLAKFLDMLTGHEIRCLVDVRSAPYSRYVPQFNRRELEEAVEQAGIRYRFLGEELGGRPSDEYYDDKGYVNYWNVATQSDEFSRGIARLLVEADDVRTAIVCSEEDPRGCHRHRLIAHALVDRVVKGPRIDSILAGRDVHVLHIRAEGPPQTEEQLRPPRPPAEQSSLWSEDGREGTPDPEWRSVGPIPRRSGQSSTPQAMDDQDS